MSTCMFVYSTVELESSVCLLVCLLNCRIVYSTVELESSVCLLVCLLNFRIGKLCMSTCMFTQL